MEKKSFGITGSKGFNITFPNGYTLSTQFGGGNYCKNYNAPPISREGMECEDAEIAVFGKDNYLEMPKELDHLSCGDTVIGSVDIETWLEIFNIVRGLK